MTGLSLVSVSKGQGMEKPATENLLLIPSTWLILTNLRNCSKSPLEVLVVIHISQTEESGVRPRTGVRDQIFEPSSGLFQSPCSFKWL